MSMALRVVISLLGRRRSVAPGLRPIHLAPSSGGRAEAPAQDSREPSASLVVAVRPRWAMLQHMGLPVAAANRAREATTEALVAAGAACPLTSNAICGRHMRVYFNLATLPARSFLLYDWVPGDEEVYRHGDEVTVVAAHGESVLVHVRVHRSCDCDFHGDKFGYFVYRVGAARPPAVLSPVGVLEKLGRQLYEGTTGLLRRGDGDLLVVVLGLTYSTTGPRSTAELLVLRVGTNEWEPRRPVPIVLDEGTDAEELRQWCASFRVVPVGDRFLCWINYRRGFLLSDMAEASTKLRYVPLPPVAPPTETTTGCSWHWSFNEYDKSRSRNMCAAGASTLRFVAVEPRCGGGTRCIKNGAKACETGFTVVSWTLRGLTTHTGEPLAWAKDGELDCEELWALLGYKGEGLPRAVPESPVVSPDNPDVVCFTVHRDRSYRDRSSWMIEVDMRNKEVLSVVPFTASYPWNEARHFPVKLQS